MEVLVATDDAEFATSLPPVLEEAGYGVTVAPDGRAAAGQIERRSFGAVILDLGASGLEVLRRVRELSPDTEVIVLDAAGTLESVVEAIRWSAFEYLLKPVRDEEILYLLRRIDERGARGRFEGVPSVTRRVLQLIETVAPTEATVLLEGGPARDRERIARAIHLASPRRDRPYVALTCSGMKGEPLEDLLLGHEPVAGTELRTRRPGVMERANGGTLFLDDIDEAPLSAQSKLLRVIVTRQVERIGGAAPAPVDLRIVAGTKIDLAVPVGRGEFLEELHHRLNVVPLRLPPPRGRIG